jgi:hypothetical protein
MKQASQKWNLNYHWTLAMLCARSEPYPVHVLHVTKPCDEHAIQGSIPLPLHIPHL